MLDILSAVPKLAYDHCIACLPTPFFIGLSSMDPLISQGYLGSEVLNWHILLSYSKWIVAPGPLNLGQGPVIKQSLLYNAWQYNWNNLNYQITCVYECANCVITLDR